MKQVNLLIGRFQPFTLGHLKCAEWVMKEKGIPTVICVINTTKADSRHPFLTSTMMPIFKSLIKDEKVIEDVITVASADIVLMAEATYKAGYEPISWSCGSDRIDQYTRMAEKYHDKANLPAGFEVIEIPRTDDDISATKVRNSLKNDDFKEFKSSTPHALHKYYDLLKKSLKIVLNENRIISLRDYYLERLLK